MMDVRSDRDLLLTAFADGELDEAERAEVEALLAADAEGALRVADDRALSSLLRASLEEAADVVDFTGFADAVLARLPAARPPLGARLRALFGTVFGQRPFQFALGAAAAAAIAVVASPYLRSHERPRMLLAGDPSLTQVLDLDALGDHETMLFKTSGGATIIFVQESP
ncbi:MAG TPA: hypothetical protein VN033_15715 [Vulgatibacter sp.]|nr:hypothetical protein [Vulgatibacter sp.]